MRMDITRLTISKLDIPFKYVFSHATASRVRTESIVVIAESIHGTKGFGEGCPRSYVTGETIKSAFDFFETHKKDLKRIQNLDDMKSWQIQHQGTIDENPAIWCAIELAFLDLLGQETTQSIEALLSFPELSETFQYTAVLGTDNIETFQKQLQQYSALGFTDFKLKVSGHLTDDRQKLNLLDELNIHNVRIRLDANNLWKLSEEAITYLTQLEYQFFGIEEPLEANDYQGCRKIYDALRARIILDESFLRISQFQSIQDCPETWIINIRISKMGGVLRSLAIAKQAKILGIPVIIGAQVGETSILSRAALTVANAYRDILLGQEGAVGTHLLEHDMTDQPIMFEKGGVVSPQPFGSTPGLGLNCHVSRTDLVE
ncbi:MAG: enolase C-terminal domain-like protein [Nitrospirota bacterium]|nr:enolase C-terminal domain-like protein [Nitrospirota bacterium]